MFGFQIYDADDQIFDFADGSVIKASISTTTNEWRNETDEYELTRDYPYAMTKCKNLYGGDRTQEYLEMSEEMLHRTGVLEFTCPRNFNREPVEDVEYQKFIDG